MDITTLENWLWEAACSIRGPLDAPKYKDYILPLLFYKRLSDVYEDELQKLGQEFGDGVLARQLAREDRALIRFYIPNGYTWPEVRKSPIRLGERLTEAMRAIAKENPKLQGVIDMQDFNATTAGQRILDDDALARLMEILNRQRLGLHNVEPDILGRAYEYLLRKFAEGSGQSAGEFYTPKEVGMLMAYKRESSLEPILAGIGSFLSSVPNYIIGILLLVFLGVRWELVPISQMRGSMTPGMQPGLNLAFIADIFFHAALPIATYVLTTIGGWMLTMKSSTISTLGEDYVTVARARGLSEARITTAYVGRNAALPLFTQLAINIGFIVGGSILIEQVFVYQGIGYQLLVAISNRDYPVMQGIFLVVTVSVVISNLLADFLYSRLDPRVRITGRE